jgi:hypothetical protein
MNGRVADMPENQNFYILQHGIRWTAMPGWKEVLSEKQIWQRNVDSLPVPDDYSVEELADGIRKHLARAMVEEKADEPALARVLATAVAESTADHVERTYHFPCVLVRPEQPPQFRIGPVEFTSAREFSRLKTGAFEHYVEESSDQEHSLQRVEDFKRYVADIGWVGTVTIPPCSNASAENRAERAISTAINLLRLFFGVPHARDMRLAHASLGRTISYFHGKARFLPIKKAKNHKPQT